MEVRPKLGEKNSKKSIQYWFNSFQIHNLTGWPLVGNEGMKPYMVMMGIHSLIPYNVPASLVSICLSILFDNKRKVHD